MCSGIDSESGRALLLLCAAAQWRVTTACIAHHQQTAQTGHVLLTEDQRTQLGCLRQESSGCRSHLCQLIVRTRTLEVVSVGAIAFVYFTANSFLVAAIVSLTERKRLLTVWNANRWAALSR